MGGIHVKKNVVDILRNDAIIFGKLIAEVEKPMTSYQLAKKLFSYKNDYDLRKKESFLRWWFEKWSELGLVKCEIIDGVKNYSIDMSKVKWGEKAKLKLKCGKLTETIDLGFTIVLKVKDSWLVIPIKE